MEEEIKFKLDKKVWTLVFRECGGDDGECIWDDKEIAVNPRLNEFNMLETVIHEMQHAMFPRMTEDRVTDSAHRITLLLWRLGFRLDR